MAIFLVVLLVEVQSVDSPAREGSELLAAPGPVLPQQIDGYTIRPEPELAAALAQEYRDRSVSVVAVEAASIAVRSSAASLLAATLDPRANPKSSQFRADVLIAAAAGFGIDATATPYKTVIIDGIVIYTANAPEGRLAVWFFADAFVQLFVPAPIEAESEDIRRVIVDAQRAAMPLAQPSV